MEVCEQSEIDRLFKALGFAVADKDGPSPMILIGNDAAGYCTRAYGLSYHLRSPKRSRMLPAANRFLPYFVAAFDFSLAESRSISLEKRLSEPSLVSS